MNLTKWMWMLGLMGTVGLAGCGVSNQAGAVNVAARSSCKYHERCGNIGSGKSFTSVNDCEIRQSTFWNDHWEPADCDDRINNDNLDYCLKAIEATSCSNGLDLLVTTYDKCSTKNVCAGRN